jgi:presenilin-like A22 family membrane protease
MKVQAINYQEKIIVLWIVFLLGTLFHTQLGLMPLFHGISVASPHSHNEATELANIVYIFWLMLVFFLLPLLAIIATAFYDSKRYRIVHFGLTIFYTIMNFFHVALDLFVDPIAWYQIFLMVFLLLVGILLNIVAYQWMQNHSSRRQLIKTV